MSEDEERSVHLGRIGLHRFKATNRRGGVLPIGTGEDPDFSPVELLLAAVAGCAALDVDFITGKRSKQTFKEYEPWKQIILTVDGEEFLRVRRGFAEAMKGRAQPPGMAAQDGQGVVPRLALVDDGVQPELDREFQLLLEDGSLNGFAGAILQGRIDVAGSFIAQRRQRLPGAAGPGQTVIVEPGLANRHDARMGGQGAQVFDEIPSRFMRGVGVHADDGVNLRILLRERHRPAAALDGGADADDPRHARRGGALEDVIEIGSEVGKVEMRVSIDQHPRAYH